MKYVKNSPFNTVPTFSKSGNVNFFVEIPVGSRFKYEYNEKFGMFESNRLLPDGMTFPITYGCIPRTFADDGDCLDALILLPTNDIIDRGTLSDGRVIGALKVVDKGDLDYKLLIVPSFFPGDEINCLSDISNKSLGEISHFFETYKSNQPELPVVGPWISKPEALEVLSQSIKAYNQFETRIIVSANY